MDKTIINVFIDDQGLIENGKSRQALFNDYYHNKKGIWYKTIDVFLDERHLVYEFYWADPKIVFYDRDDLYPLAKTLILAPSSIINRRIYLHENLTRKYKKVFEYVVTHEIGHLWLFDILGIHHEFQGDELEAWADLFSLFFFVRYRKITELTQFNKILDNAVAVLAKLYKVPVKIFDGNALVTGNKTA